MGLPTCLNNALGACSNFFKFSLTVDEVVNISIPVTIGVFTIGDVVTIGDIGVVVTISVEVIIGVVVIVVSAL